MNIFCPQCGLNGTVDAAQLSGKARVVCARCSSAFEAAFEEGQLTAIFETAAPVEAVEQQATTAPPTSEVNAADHTFTPVTGGEAEDMSRELRGEPPVRSVADESTPLLEAAPTPAGAVTKVASDDEVVRVADDVTLTARHASPVIAQQTASDAALLEAPPVAAHPGSKEGGTHSDDDELATGDEAAPPADESRPLTWQSTHTPDRYGFGVRMMNVSPGWLLLAGLSFIAFILFCNWVVAPADQPRAVAAERAPRGNQATNQSAPAEISSPKTSAAVNQVAPAPGDGATTTPAVTTAQVEPTPLPAAPPAQPTPARTQDVTPSQPARRQEASPTATTQAGGRFTVQVGSYDSTAEAEARAESLRAAGFEATVAPVELPRRGTWYRVQSGRFATREEATRLGARLKAQGAAADFIYAELKD